MTLPLIAVVDNEQSTLSLMEAILTSEGYRTMLWPTATGTLELIRQHQPVALVLDISNGQAKINRQFLEELHIDDATANLPVIVYSTDHQMLENAATVLTKLGAQLIEKPFDIDELLTLLAQATNQDYS